MENKSHTTNRSPLGLTTRATQRTGGRQQLTDSEQRAFGLGEQASHNEHVGLGEQESHNEHVGLGEQESHNEQDPFGLGQHFTLGLDNN